MLCFITSHQVLWAWIWGCTRITPGQSRGILSALQGCPWTSVCPCESGHLSLPLLSQDPHSSSSVWHHLAATAIWSLGHWRSWQVCVCVCVVGWCLGRASGVARVGPLHYLGTRNTLGRAPGPAASHGGPGCAGISFANIYVCYFLCVSGKSCVSNFNLPLQDSF